MSNHCSPHNGTKRARQRVLATGANGLIGGFLMRAWWAPRSQCEPVGLARRAGGAEGGLASSNHAIGRYELEGEPALYALDDGRVYDHTAEPRPDSLYGVSKVYGEALGRHYVDQYGLSVVCLRIRGARWPDDLTHPDNLWADMSGRSPETLASRRRMRAVWLSERDCVQLIEMAVLTDGPWVLVYGIANNPRRFWDIEHARRVLGYEPRDAAPALIGEETTRR